MLRKQLPWDFCAKIDFFAVLALVGTKLSENDEIQILTPSYPMFGVCIPFGTPRVVSAPMPVIYQRIFIMLTVIL